MMRQSSPSPSCARSLRTHRTTEKGNTMELDAKITQMADAMADELIRQRRDLHRHPEPGWTEFRTASIVAKTLSELGYEVQVGREVMEESARMGVPSDDVLAREKERARSEGADPTWLDRMDGGFTGVVGTMHFARKGPVVGIRFDMDSNDVTETDAPEHFPNSEGFASCHAGAMHACGHDGHTSVGLGVARIFAALRDELAGTVKLVFQPAEEGVRGAHAMVEKGVVDDVNYMLGAHFGFKAKETGSVACNVVGFLATSKYDAHFVGVPAHAGAAPEEGKNAVLATACAALNLHAISRHSGGASRINVGYMEAGSGRNVIGDKGLLRIETRGATSAINRYMEQEAERIIKAAAAMYDVNVTIEKAGGAAGGNNTPELASYLENRAKELGLFRDIMSETNFGASEDFSYFMERVQERGGQAAYMMIGAQLAAGHHDSRFNFDEKALVYAAKMIAASGASLLLGQ